MLVFMRINKFIINVTTSAQTFFKRGHLTSGVDISTFMFDFILTSGLSRRVVLLSGWPLKRGSTVYIITF